MFPFEHWERMFADRVGTDTSVAISQLQRNAKRITPYLRTVLEAMMRFPSMLETAADVVFVEDDNLPNDERAFEDLRQQSIPFSSFAESPRARGEGLVGSGSASPRLNFPGLGVGANRSRGQKASLIDLAFSASPLTKFHCDVDIAPRDLAFEEADFLLLLSLLTQGCVRRDEDFFRGILPLSYLCDLAVGNIVRRASSGTKIEAMSASSEVKAAAIHMITEVYVKKLRVKAFDAETALSDELHAGALLETIVFCLSTYCVLDPDSLQMKSPRAKQKIGANVPAKEDRAGGVPRSKTNDRIEHPLRRLCFVLGGKQVADQLDVDQEDVSQPHNVSCAQLLLHCSVLRMTCVFLSACSDWLKDNKDEYRSLLMAVDNWHTKVWVPLREEESREGRLLSPLSIFGAPLIDALRDGSVEQLLSSAQDLSQSSKRGTQQSREDVRVHATNTENRKKSLALLDSNAASMIRLLLVGGHIPRSIGDRILAVVHGARDSLLFSLQKANAESRRSGRPGRDQNSVASEVTASLPRKKRSRQVVWVRSLLSSAARSTLTEDLNAGSHSSTQNPPTSSSAGFHGRPLSSAGIFTLEPERKRRFCVEISEKVLYFYREKALKKYVASFNSLVNSFRQPFQIPDIEEATRYRPRQENTKSANKLSLERSDLKRLVRLVEVRKIMKRCFYS